MSQPHHHVFNAIQRQINTGVPVKEVLHLLLEKRVIKPELKDTVEKGGMKIVTGYLRNQDFDTFLAFVECVCIACCDPMSSRKIMYETLDSIQQVVKDFDANHGTQHCSRVTAILDRYMNPATMLEGTSEVEEAGELMHVTCYACCFFQFAMQIVMVYNESAYSLSISIISSKIII